MDNVTCCTPADSNQRDCPHCGRCPTCGRTAQPQGYYWPMTPYWYPVYPYQPTYPYHTVWHSVETKPAISITNPPYVLPSNGYTVTANTNTTVTQGDTNATV